MTESVSCSHGAGGGTQAGLAEVQGPHQDGDMPLRLMPRSLRHTHTPHPPPRPDSSWAHSSPLIPALGAFGALWDLLRGDPDPAGDGASSASIPGRGQGTAAVTCRMMSPSGLPPGLPGPFPNCSLGCFWPASAPGRVFTLCLEKKLPDPCLPPWEQAARGGVSLANHGERGCHGLPPSLGGHRLAWDIPLGGGGAALPRGLPACSLCGGWKRG